MLNEPLNSAKADKEALEQDRTKQLTDCLTLALSHCGESAYPSGSNPDTETAISHTLLGGAKPRNATPGVSTLSMGGVLMRASNDEVRRTFTDPQVVAMRLGLMQKTCKRPVFFVTESRHVGLASGFFPLGEKGPKDGQGGEEKGLELYRGTEDGASRREYATRKGDGICVARGCVTPFVIRPVSQKFEGQVRWELVGECYENGLMNREAVVERWEHVSEEDIVFV